ncbi:MAG: discoidin domain-containing protein, partial [Verrucomicrobiales bacterium]
MKRSALAAALALSVAVSPAADIDFLTKAKPATGHSVMGKGEVEFAIPPQQARFIKLEAHGSGDFAAAAAEIRLVGKGGAVVDPKRWKLVGASGGEATAKSAYDADPATSWVVPAAPGPHWVAIDLGRVESFSALRYVPAADGSGAVGPFQLFVGHDGKAFDAIASGTLIGGAHGEG